MRARSVAAIQDRSLTEQVEHWARLGQVVEAAVSANTMERLKAMSHDPELPGALAFADSAEGRASAAEMIRAENEVRYEELSSGKVDAVSRDGKRTALAKTAVSSSAARAPAKARPQLRAVADSRATAKLPRKRAGKLKLR
jgi:hypothetical protein